MKNNKSYLLTTLCRSLDDKHYGKNIHLLGSVFHTKEYDFTSLNPVEGQIYLIIKLSLDKDKDITYSQHPLSRFAYEANINLLVFLELYANYGFMHLDHFIKGFFVNKENKKYLQELKDLESVLNQSLFVFEDVNWFTLQALFKNFNIDLSGGTISKRFVLNKGLID